MLKKKCQPKNLHEIKNILNEGEKRHYLGDSPIWLVELVVYMI